MHRWDLEQTSEQQSQYWTVSTENLENNDLNPSLFINTECGIRLHLLPVPHGGSGMKTGGAYFCNRIVYSWWQYAATDGVCKQYTSHVTFFSCLRALVMLSHTTLAQGVSARHLIHESCACLFDLFDPRFALFISLSHLLLLLEPWLLPFPLPCGSVRNKITCALRLMRSLALWPITHLSCF